MSRLLGLKTITTPPGNSHVWRACKARDVPAGRRTPEPDHGLRHTARPLNGDPMSGSNDTASTLSIMAQKVHGYPHYYTASGFTCLIHPALDFARIHCNNASLAGLCNRGLPSLMKRPSTNSRTPM